MRFVKFIDNRYQELAVEQAKFAFSAWRDAEANALQLILAIVRLFLKVLFIPKVLVHYVLVCFRISKQPSPELFKLQAQHDSMKKSAKKVGMELKK